MRKLFALLIAVLLLLPAVALADAEYQDYANATDGYRMKLPADWTVLDKDNVDRILTAMTDGSLDLEGMDTSVIQQYKAQIDAMDMMVCIDAVGNNLNVVYQALPMALGNDLLISSVLPTALEQLKGMLPDFQLVAEPTVYPVGDREFVAAVYTFSVGGVSMIGNQAYYLDGAKLYNITVTIQAAQSEEKLAELDQMIDDVLASFVPGSEASTAAPEAPAAA